MENKRRTTSIKINPEIWKNFKLHCIKNKYYWIALWNSIVHIGAVNGYKTIEHAIKAMIKEGYSIEEYHFDEIFNQ